MSMVLVVERDTAQANVLRQVILKRVGAELVLVQSTAAAIDAITQRMPDLILLSALLSPRDEETLISHLRTLDNASHLQTLTIPQLRKDGKSGSSTTSAFGFRKKRQGAAPSGCDPAVFAEEIVAHLAYAAEMQKRPSFALPVRPAARGLAGTPYSGEPPSDRVAQAQSFVEPAPLSDMSAFVEPEAPAQPEIATSYEPAGYEPGPSVDVLAELARAQAESRAEAEARLAAEAARAQAESRAEAEARRAAAEAKRAAEVARAQAESQAEAQAKLAEEVARAQAAAQADAEARLAAEIERVRADAEAHRLAELARVQAEADAIRGKAIAEARAAAELEARETLAAELARVRAEAEGTFAEQLNKVKVEAEATLGKEIGRAREDVDELRRLRAEAQEAFAADLARVRSEVEQSLSAQLQTARAEAERVRAAEVEIARVRAESEAQLKAERVRLAEAEVARVRAEAEAQVQAELERVRVEAERLKEQADRVKEEADRARWVEKTKAKQAAQQIKEEATLQARAVAEAEARRALEAEIARVRSEADSVLEAELARTRAEAEARQAAELEKLRTQMAEMRQSAAQQARAAAAEAVLSEVARAATQSKLTIVRNEPNVIQFKPAAPQAATSGSTPGIYRFGADRDASSTGHSDNDESGEFYSTSTEAHVDEPIAEQEAQPVARRDYYSLWQRKSASAKDLDWTDDESLGWRSPLPGAKWALPIAACLLLVTNHGLAISTVARLVRPGDRPVKREAIVAKAAPKPVAAVPSVDRTTGELIVESNPSGAEVLIDGESHGQTPVTIRKLKPGTYRLVLRSKAGTIARTVTIRAGEKGMVSEAIFAGWLAIFSEIPLEIFLDGRPATMTDDGRVMTTPGKHQIEMVSERFKFRTTETLEVRPGDITALTVTLPLGTVHLSAPEGTEIRIGGELAGRMPMEDLSIAIGPREFTAVHPLLGERRVTVDVRHGEVVDVKFYSE